MKTAIKALIAEYKQKQDDCATLIAGLDERIRRAGRLGAWAASLRQDRAARQAQRHAYVQAQADIESLLDHLPEWYTYTPGDDLQAEAYHVELPNGNRAVCRLQRCNLSCHVWVDLYGVEYPTAGTRYREVL